MQTNFMRKVDEKLRHGTDRGFPADSGGLRRPMEIQADQLDGYP